MINDKWYALNNFHYNYIKSVLIDYYLLFASICWGNYLEKLFVWIYCWKSLQWQMFILQSELLIVEMNESLLTNTLQSSSKNRWKTATKNRTEVQVFYFHTTNQERDIQHIKWVLHIKISTNMYAYGIISEIIWMSANKVCI